ncbi:Transcriptional regulatory protein ZraR [Achromobacter deleyi]|uniref:Transcriptional regulatory protein ZraR n=1 Tax=Achromobacter deleyi TaxID=1353891 RepID=A0A6S7AAN0_9BURK|nr:sigma-54 dependent transcriptional regulator [Achromobacter deleyi]CAB3720427.1 Transcriptional regulatory protein ZraR [Achromobacter deleyi]CAB3844686.1 Transcriptional regulatory protein ZraR [Achromobacter deleyi]CAB3892087.1 Transcriptional regulatory protein ZraR [Achromobacter deleyi]CAB3915794.1 Transcriptional regulatory protein ZraR [Achromobacter deleyi]
MPDRSVGDRKDAATADINPLDVSGLSPVMQKLATQLRLAAGTDASVFIVGESGAGKEVVARAIHDASARRDRPFVAINCGAISGSLAHAELFGHEKGSFTGAVAQNAGYFEYASGGTLFLDEVTEMPPDMQVHFLRVLEAGTYQRVGGADLLRANVRIICASNRDPAASVADGRLRQDFLHRLLVIPLRVPPLRERTGDALILAQRFLDALNRQHATHKRFSKPMLDAIAQHDWPGNVRELRNAVQRAYILSDDVLDIALPRPRAAQRAEFKDGALNVPVGTALGNAQRDFILATLAHHGGDKRLAAETLGVSLKTLYNRLDVYEKEQGGPAAA